MLRIDLRRLILSLCLLSVALAMLNGFYSSLVVQRDILVQNTLETNRAYAAKLANTTQQMLDNARSTLRYAARVMGAGDGILELAAREVDRLQQQSSFFNAVFAVDANAVVLAASSVTSVAVGQTLQSREGLAAFAAREPSVSEPFRTANGRWVLTLWQPAFTADGAFRGMLGGTIYLHEANILHALLAEQSHKDGSYVYVVDAVGKLIYHPDGERIGESVFDLNAAVRRVLTGDAGALDLVNSRGVRMLAGYAPVPGARWGVVSQQTYDAAVMPLSDLMWRTVRNSLPLLAIVLLAIWWTSERIALPLRRMAKVVRQLDGKRAAELLTSVDAWYFEAAQLRRALLTGLSSLQRVLAGLRQDSVTDALTGLLNRRGLAVVLEELQATRTSFGVICFDVDHFKAVNDTHGHAVGDDILRQVAEVAGHHSRDDDVICRSGGEEFLMLLPRSSHRDTEQAAERLREAIAGSRMARDIRVTVSLGVSHWTASTDSPDAAIHAADLAMYEAKTAGRNLVRTAPLWHP